MEFIEPWKEFDDLLCAIGKKYILFAQMIDRPITIKIQNEMPYYERNLVRQELLELKITEKKAEMNSRLYYGWIRGVH